jgi:hypothetical protein
MGEGRKIDGVGVSHLIHFSSSDYASNHQPTTFGYGHVAVLLFQQLLVPFHSV